MKTLFFLFFGYISFAQDVWVEGYTRNNDTYVDGHYRTSPDNTANNNYSTLGNINPHTGEWGTKPRESSYYYDVNYMGSTNPLASITPAPVSKIESDYYQSEATHIETTSSNRDTSYQSGYSQNYKDYLYEKEHPQPLKDFEDDKVKFVDNSTPVQTPTPVEPENTNSASIVFGIFAVLFIFILLYFATRKNQE